MLAPACARRSGKRPRRQAATSQASAYTRSGRLNITWRQEVGASANEASKIAGYVSVNMTNDYTHVQLKRQDELTRAIQNRLGEVAQKMKEDSGNALGFVPPTGGAGRLPPEWDAPPEAALNYGS